MRVVVSSSPVSTNALLKIEIPVDKKLIANALIKTHKKLEEPILAVMFKYGLNWIQLLLWLQQSLFHGISWYGLS